MEIDPFVYDHGLLQDSYPFCWICWEVWFRGHMYFITLTETVFIVWYLQTLFYFSPLDWNQDCNFCPECCCNSKNCRPCPSKDQNRGSVLWKRKMWNAHPSCKPPLPWHPSPHFLVVPGVYFATTRHRPQSLGTRTWKSGLWHEGKPSCKICRKTGKIGQRAWALESVRTGFKF